MKKECVSQRAVSNRLASDGRHSLVYKAMVGLALWPDILGQIVRQIVNEKRLRCNRFYHSFTTRPRSPRHF